MRRRRRIVSYLAKILTLKIGRHKYGALSPDITATIICILSFLAYYDPPLFVEIALAETYNSIDSDSTSVLTRKEVAQIRKSCNRNILAKTLVDIFLQENHVYTEVMLAHHKFIFNYNNPIVGVTGGILCFFGEINVSSAATASRYIDDGVVRLFAVDSGGGDAEAAIDLANVVYRMKLSIVIMGECLSSCANYLFVVADKKYFTNDAIVGWHGGPPLDSPNAAIRRIVEKQDKLLTLVGVSSDLIYYAPTIVDNDGLFQRHKSEGRRPFWTYTDAYLKTAFHILNIYYMKSFDIGHISNKRDVDIFSGP